MVYLSHPGITTAIGKGLLHHINTLMAGTSPTITIDNDIIPGKAIPISYVDDVPELPDCSSAETNSRNNRLLWSALQQIDPLIQEAILRYGRTRIGVVLGTSNSGVNENIEFYRNIAEGGDGGHFCYQTQHMAAAVRFVTQHYNLANAAFSVSTACTSGARSLISAARLLHLGFCDAVICGGVDAISQLTVNGFSALSVLSSHATQPFSKHRNGTHIGEGAAVFLMTRERLPESLPLIGYGASADAYHMSTPHPEGKGASIAMRAALNHAQLSASEIGWINLHGTGTLHNDAMESKATANVFGIKIPCTSTKTHTGHTLGAAGAVEAALLWGFISRQYNPEGLLPPQYGCPTKDDTLTIRLTSHHDHFPDNKRRIGASFSFAFGGSNAVLIIGEDIHDTIQSPTTSTQAT